jgi:uncharacterized repeat protein (TIGR04076 family)
VGLIIHVDGGARGNPGPAGAGVAIRTEGGDLVHEAGYFLGRQTNNAAEYHAVLRALERAQRCPAQPITLFSDSELLVRQLTGEYRVKSPRLALLHRQAQVLLLKIPRWCIRHVRREENLRADELANLAMDQQQDVVVFDVELGPTTPAAPEEKREDSALPETAAVRASVQAAPAPTGAPTAAPETGHPAIRVTVAHPPRAGGCPAGKAFATAFTINSVLPAGLCVHAAHAILPTLLAMMNTDPQEFAAVPTLTVRCGHPGCNAVFELSPTRSDNGVPHAKRS